MIITGVSHKPERLFERSSLPSNELVYLASKALKSYKATRLITSLEPGWEQALAKAAIELKIPYVIALPYPGRNSEWSREARVAYYELLSRAEEVYQINDSCSETALFECHTWQVDRADVVLALWDYEFEGDTFAVIDYALQQDVEVGNLWQDWSSLYKLRKQNTRNMVESSRKGAQVF